MLGPKLSGPFLKLLDRALGIGRGKYIAIAVRWLGQYHDDALVILLSVHACGSFRQHPIATDKMTKANKNQIGWE